MTMRREPMIHWFFDSLHTECQGDYSWFRVGIIDFRVDDPGRRDKFAKAFRGDTELIHRAPIPSVWQGPTRLTKRNFFDAANARNTALCLAQDGWIAYVDDLTVLMKGWLTCVREAMARCYIGLGSYRKVKKLQVQYGEVIDYEDDGVGWDSRWKFGNDAGPVPASGNWLYGCSFVAPVQALVDINGFDTDSTPMGGEDYIAGIMMEKAGYKFQYDRRMFSLEADDLHDLEQDNFLRIIERTPGRLDASQVLLNMVLYNNRRQAPNYYPGGISGLRQKTLRGEPFPTIGCPQHSWYSGKRLHELDLEPQL